MISDFSSIVVDYAITKKPILIIDSLTNDYAENRGFILKDNFKMLTPGERICTFKELLHSIYDNLNNNMCNYESMLPLLHKYTDGNACKRILDIMKNM